MFGWLDLTHYILHGQEYTLSYSHSSTFMFVYLFLRTATRQCLELGSVKYLDPRVIIIKIMFQDSAFPTTTFWYFMLLQHFSSCLQLFHDFSTSKFTKSLAICAPRHSASPTEVSLEPRCQKHGWPETVGHVSPLQLTGRILIVIWSQWHHWISFQNS